MFRTIDCVMVPVPDLDAAVDFYERVFGLRINWRDATSVGMRMPESGVEVVLNTENISGVHYLVDDVIAAVGHALDAGCTVTVAPFDIVMGKCAVLADPFGNPVGAVALSYPGGPTLQIFRPDRPRPPTGPPCSPSVRCLHPD